MSNSQIALQFVGWGFLLFLSNRTIRRTELSRLKDQLIGQIEEISTWFEQALKSDEYTVHSLERAYIAKVARIDLLLQQLNGLSKHNLINTGILFDFWNLDIETMYETKKLTNVNIFQQDAIESIEISYHSIFFKENIIRRIHSNYKPELYGVLLTLASLYFLYRIVEVLFS